MEVWSGGEEGLRGNAVEVLKRELLRSLFIFVNSSLDFSKVLEELLHLQDVVANVVGVVSKFIFHLSEFPMDVEVMGDFAVMVYFGAEGVELFLGIGELGEYVVTCFSRHVLWVRSDEVLFLGGGLLQCG